MILRPLLAVGALVASGLVLAGCASGSAGATDATVSVVASTNVYGRLVEQVGGERVDVTSIVTSSAQDPHSYEATARDQLALQRADLVVENGGGYDAFVDTLLAGVDNDPGVITAVEFSHDWPGNAGHDAEASEQDAEDHADHAESDHEESADADADHDHEHVEGFNEHVWYDVHTVSHVVEAIAAELSAVDPDGKSDYEASAAALIADLEAIEASLADVKAAHEGDGVFLTEPVPGYLAIAAGLIDVAPEGFASSVEEGRDVSPATLLDALTVIESGEARVLLSNPQTGGAETTRVEKDAEAAGIPVVDFTELVPDGSTYAEWMSDNVARLAAALKS